MATAKQKALTAALLERHGRTYCDELGIRIDSDTPQMLFRWLVASILFSARISADAALKAARALNQQGWSSADKMAAASWADRTKVLNRSGYARYDESTSRMLGATAERAVERYRGDLRRLREEAGRDPARERALLKAFKGIGDVGADIFCREVQLAWDEIYPFADRRAQKAAERFGLPPDAKALAKLVERRRFPHLLAALVRADLAKDHAAIRERAAV